MYIDTVNLDIELLTHFNVEFKILVGFPNQNIKKYFLVTKQFQKFLI